MLVRLGRRLISTNIGERYALTLLKVAEEDQSLQQVAEDMKFVEQLYAESKDFKVLITDPTIKKSEQQKLLHEVMEEANFATASRRVIELLSENKRLNSLNDMAKRYKEYMLAKEKREVVKVVSATALNDQEKDEVEAALRDYDTSKKYELSYDVDASILGGVQLYFPTAFMDLSLRSRLEKIRDELAGIAP